MTDPVTGAHLDPHEVTAYLGGGLAPAEKGRLEAHLADCDECAEELVAVARLGSARPARPRWLGIAAAAAAAVIALALVGPRVVRDAPDTVPPVRGDTSATLALAAPADGAELDRPPLFAWHPVPGAAAYRISVTLADGDSVWAATTSDTTARAPEALLPPRPDGYYWYVDVLLADGRSLGGTPRRFRLLP